VIVTIKDWLPANVQTASTERSLRRGQSLFRQGTPTVGLYEVVKGTMRLVRVDRSGREAVLHTAGAGDTFAEASLFSPTYHCDAVALAPSVVRLYPKPMLLAAFRRDPERAQAFMGMLARQIMDVRMQLERRSIQSARERVLHYLAVNAGADRRTVRLRGTLKQLAGELGLTHEALYRTLAEMARAGEIERSRGVIRLSARSYDPDHT
jgi:CRP-like cAMP-binding protein